MRSPKLPLRTVHVLCILGSALGLLPIAQAQISNCTAVTAYQYAPAYTKTYIGADQTSRYVYQYVNWSSDPARLDWFKRPYAPGANFSAGTFEQDTFFYNYDGLAYGIAPSGYWASDLPYPYVDTQAFDPPQEKAVTIGSAHAFDVTLSRYYYYVTRFTSGAGTSSRFKSQSQRGLREPVGCFGAHCSFGCDTPANYDRLIPFDSSYLAPGCKQVQFLGPPFNVHSITSCPYP